MDFYENIGSAEDTPEIELLPGIQQLAVAVLLQAVRDLNNKKFADDAKQFLSGTQALRFWLAVAGIDDIGFLTRRRGGRLAMGAGQGKAGRNNFKQPGGGGTPLGCLKTGHKG